MSGNFPKRGNIYWVPLDPAVGSKTKKTRPCLIVSNDIGNEYSNAVIIAPITSKVKKIQSYEVKIELAGKIGKIMLHQCRVVDKSRIGKMIDCSTNSIMEQVNEALRIVFDLT